MVMLIFYCTCILWSLPWPALFCYVANLTTDRIYSLGDIAYEMDWFEYPPEIHKFFILIIARSQIPADFTGFKLIRCTLETFVQVRIPLNFG